MSTGGPGLSTLPPEPSTGRRSAYGLARRWWTTGRPDLPPIVRLMAERTTQSWTQVPHFFLVRDLDATPLNEIRAKLGPGVESAKSVKLTHTDLLVALVARVLTKHPKMNAS